MLEALKTFLSNLADGRRPERFEENDYRLAAAALLVHAVSIDGNATEAEHGQLRALLRERFALGPAETEELIAQASDAQRQAVDLYQFTRLLDRSLDQADRLRLIKMMWQIALVDGRLDEFEDNLIWRVADLLHVSTRERVALRREVAGGAAPPLPED